MRASEGITLSDVRKMKIEQLRTVYLDLTGASATTLTLKADLRSAVEKILMDRAHRAYAAQQDRHRRERDTERQRWREDNDRARKALNSVFEGMPPVPLFGDDR